MNNIWSKHKSNIMIGILLILFIVLVVLIYLLTNKSNDATDATTAARTTAATNDATTAARTTAATNDATTAARTTAATNDDGGVLFNQGTVIDNSEPEGFSDSNEVILNIGDLIVKYTPRPVLSYSELLEALKNENEPEIERLILSINEIDIDTDDDMRDVLILFIEEEMRKEEEEQEHEEDYLRRQEEQDQEYLRLMNIWVEEGSIPGNEPQYIDVEYYPDGYPEYKDTQRFEDIMNEKMNSITDEDNWEENKISYNKIIDLFMLFLYFMDEDMEKDLSQRNHNLIAYDSKSDKYYVIIDFDQETFNNRLTVQHNFVNKIGQFFIPTEQNTQNEEELDLYINCTMDGNREERCRTKISNDYRDGTDCREYEDDDGSNFFQCRERYPRTSVLELVSYIESYKREMARDAARAAEYEAEEAAREAEEGVEVEEEEEAEEARETRPRAARRRSATPTPSPRWAARQLPPRTMLVLRPPDESE